MNLIDLSADELSAKLLGLSETETVCILDSCGVGHLGSHLMIAGISPVEILEISDNADETLKTLEEKLSDGLAAIFTISYEFGLRLQEIKPRVKEFAASREPDIFIALFDALITHDYTTGETKLTGNPNRFTEIVEKLNTAGPNYCAGVLVDQNAVPKITSNFTRSEYLAAVETVKEYIRSGDTYQANITQQLSVDLPHGVTSQVVFSRLRKNNPAPFAAFIKRKDSTVVSASPERFVRIEEIAGSGFVPCVPWIKEAFSTEHTEQKGKSRITASPIKGTRSRGATPAEDTALRSELLASAKDRAENTMIVDLIRNDLGRICEYGSVAVEKLCEIEEHPTLFHLVSTVTGELRKNVSISEIIRAAFPCGSITGAPKIRTMQIIDEIETAPRGLSMGAIGYLIPDSKFQMADSSFPISDFESQISDTSEQTQNAKPNPGKFIMDLSVAIRTMVIYENRAVFNVGGGIVIDSDPAKEYEESLLKAKALLRAVSGQQSIVNSQYSV